MKLYAPKYYTEFKCIADRCTHSCCIGWEIDIDPVTVQKYSTLKQAYADTVRGSIEYGDTPHFKLEAHDRCPHLNSKNLCNIILSLGEDCLCDICREHPRFYNDSALGREVGLGIACEEACRIVLSSDDYSLIPVGEICDDACEAEYDTVTCRERIYSILSDTSLSHSDKLTKIQSEFRISVDCISDAEARDLIDSFEFLDEDRRESFKMYSSKAKLDASFDRTLDHLLAYFVFRHCTEECDASTYRAALGMCLFLERLFVSVALSENAYDEGALISIARMISEEIEYSESNTESIKLEFLFRQ